MEIIVYLDKDYNANETIVVPDNTTLEECKRIVDEKYGESGWWYFDLQ
jgi:hypothetical protein